MCVVVGGIRNVLSITCVKLKWNISMELTGPLPAKTVKRHSSCYGMRPVYLNDNVLPRNCSM